MEERLYRDLAVRLRKRREELNMSQEAVAGRAGLTRSSVANTETGRQAVMLHQLYALARALECSPESLMPASAPLPDPAATVTPRQVELFVASLAGAGSRSGRARS